MLRDPSEFMSPEEWERLCADVDAGPPMTDDELDDVAALFVQLRARYLTDEDDS